MTSPNDPSQRSNKGDHNRRLSLGIEAEEFAAEAGISAEDLRKYEFAPMDWDFDPEVARKVGAALVRLESTRSPKVTNGPSDG